VEKGRFSASSEGHNGNPGACGTPCFTVDAARAIE
jgi:hypothetical protein